MEIATILGVLKESLFFLVVFGAFFILAMARGMQTIINIILSLYLALLISLKFPYFSAFLTSGNEKTNSVVMVILFSLFTLAGFFLFRRLMPVDYREPPLTDFWKKLLYALFATILVTAYSYHALPLTDLITPGSPIQALFAPEQNFFWWLIVPLIGLFFV